MHSQAHSITRDINRFSCKIHEWKWVFHGEEPNVILGQRGKRIWIEHVPCNVIETFGANPCRKGLNTLRGRNRERGVSEAFNAEARFAIPYLEKLPDRFVAAHLTGRLKMLDVNDQMRGVHSEAFLETETVVNDHKLDRHRRFFDSKRDAEPGCHEAHVRFPTCPLLKEQVCCLLKGLGRFQEVAQQPLCAIGIAHLHDALHRNVTPRQALRHNGKQFDGDELEVYLAANEASHFEVMVLSGRPYRLP